MAKNNITQLVVGAIQTNCWIYPFDKGTSEAVVIDPGDEAEVIISTLKKLNLVPKYILLTHGHFDHTGAAADLAKAFPEASIAIHRLDSAYLGKDVQSNSLRICELEEGDSIGLLTVLHTPGHTHGSVVFWDKESKVLFSGDTLFYAGYGRTDLGGNQEQLVESLRRLFVMDGDIEVYPGHGETTTIAREAARFVY